MTDPQEILQPQGATPSGDGEWTEPTMEHVPRATYWPAVMAMGTVLMFWGVATMVAVSLVGFGLFVLSLIGWIREMYHAG